MTKRFAQVVSMVTALCMFVSLTAGCSSNKDNKVPAPNTEKVETKAKDKVQVKIWQRNSGSGGPMFDFLQNYNASQNEIEAVYEGYGENYFNLVNIALASGEAPEIFEAQSNPPVVTFAESGHILPVDELLTDAFKKKFHESSFKQKDFYFNNKLYTIPLRIQHYKLLYNKDIFKKAGLDPSKPPQTLEEVSDFAKKITQAGKGEFYGMGMYNNYASVWLRYIDMIAIANGDSGTYGFDYKTGRFDFSKEKKYFDYWLQMSKDGSFFPGYITLGVEQMRANFAQGKVGMMIDGNWMSTQYATNIKTDVDWDAVPIPLFSGAKRAKDYMTCDITFVIAKDSKNVEGAKKLYKTIVEKQGDFRKFGDADTKTYSDANTKAIFDLLPKDLTFKGLTEMNNVSNVSAFPIEPYKFIKLEGDNRDKALSNEFAMAVDGKYNLDKTLADLTKRYNEALDKAIAEGNLKIQDLKLANFDYFSR